MFTDPYSSDVFGTNFGHGGSLQSIQTQIAQAAFNQFNQVFSMANDAYNKAAGYSDQVIPALIQMGQKSAGAGNSMWNRYQSTYMPLENQLIKDANTYASPSRIASDMGSAEAGQQQAGNQGRIAAEQNLQSFGIDPSSGRYADLEMANRAATAAAAAGAGQQARLNTEATGRQLRSQAIQVGQQYPGQAANFMNSATNANATAANAADALANTRANLLQVPAQYLQAGSMATRSSGGGMLNTTATHSDQGNGSGGGRSAGDGSGGGGGRSAGGNGGSGGRNGGGSNGGGGGGDGGWVSGFFPNAQITQVQPSDQSTDSQDFGGMSDTGITDYSSDNNYDYGGQSDPLASSYGDNTSYNDYGNYDGTDYGSYGSDYSSPGDYSSVDMGSAPSDWSSYDTSGDTGANWGDSYSGSDYSSGSDMSSVDYGGDMAQGGDVSAIDDGSGQMVPPSASPSGGQQTDDVKANLNVHEFVVPQDVALWKGQEFFQNLIKKSREARMGAQAKGKPGPALPGPVRFSTTG